MSTDAVQPIPGKRKAGKSFPEVARTLLDSKKINVIITLPDGTRKNWVMEANVNFRHVLAVALLKEAISGNVQAAKELVDRTDGKVTEHVHLESDGPLVEVIQATQINEAKSEIQVDGKTVKRLADGSGQSEHQANPA
jgi:hypothetical protein